MTDAEKELRRLAQEEASGEGLGHFHEEATPAAVLALLERIEALEKAVITAHRELYEGGNDKESALSAESILSEFVP